MRDSEYGIPRRVLAMVSAIGLLVTGSCTLRSPQYLGGQSSARMPDSVSVSAENSKGESAAKPDSLRADTPVPEGPPDSDADGVADLHDHCRNTPAHAIVDAMGCPHDEDGDGVYDGIDQCPGTMAIVGLVVDSTGCPADADRDGVPDYQDLCKDTPSGVPVNTHGCPTDTDGDGVADYLDQCPGTPAGVAVTSAGCVPDGDGDGVADADDLCPNTPKGLDVDAGGCLVMTQLDRRLILYVNYVPGTTDPDPMSLRVLDDLAARLVRAPDMVAVVEGFTDNIGLDSANLAVSQKRADKIAEYLTKKGVDTGQIESYGRGESDFIADNATAAGRQKNRRIEISFRSANSN